MVVLFKCFHLPPPSPLLLQVAVPLYYAAFRFSTPILLANTCNYVLSHYGNIEDPEHEALLHILDNTPQK